MGHDDAINHDATDEVDDHGHHTVTGGANDDDLTGDINDDLLFGHGGRVYASWRRREQHDCRRRRFERRVGFRSPAAPETIWIRGNGGDDSIRGGDGSNVAVGGFGRDDILTGSNDDLLFGNQGDDHMDAGAGANLVFGGRGNDSIVTGSGNDTVWGNEDNDTLVGGAGADRYEFAAGSGADRVQEFQPVGRRSSEPERSSVYGRSRCGRFGADQPRRGRQHQSRRCRELRLRLGGLSTEPHTRRL